MFTLYWQKYLATYTLHLQESKSRGINVELVSPSAAITASTVLGRLSGRFWSVYVGVVANLSRRASVRSDTAVGWQGLARSLQSSSSQRSSTGLRSGPSLGPVKFLPNSSSHACECAAKGTESWWNRKYPITTLEQSW